LRSRLERLPYLFLLETYNAPTTVHDKGRERATGIEMPQFLEGFIPPGTFECVYIDVLVPNIHLIEKGLGLLAPDARTQCEEFDLTPGASFNPIHFHREPPPNPILIELHCLFGLFGRLLLFFRSLHYTFFILGFRFLFTFPALCESALTFLFLLLESIGLFSSFVASVSTPLGH
jgi:hypothetical protein